MGSSSDIDISVTSLYRAWRLFRRGKRASREIIEFEYDLERNLFELSRDIQAGTYVHGTYTSFMVYDNKRRVIAVATVRDRVVHRLLYEYLVMHYNKVFIYDVWSCRPNKGLLGAHQRTSQYMWKYRDGWLWRGDVAKFFDTIQHAVLLRLVMRRTNGIYEERLLKEVVRSYGSGVGVPIGNLTSQIFANIYLHEFDRFVVHTLKPHGYVRYGDDFVLWGGTCAQVEDWAALGVDFLCRELDLSLHAVNYAVQPARRYMHFLGLDFWSTGRRLDARMRGRMRSRVQYGNLASYRAIAHHHESSRREEQLIWSVAMKLTE